MGKLGSSIVGALFLVTSVTASAEPQLNDGFDPAVSGMPLETSAQNLAGRLSKARPQPTTAPSSAPGWPWVMQHLFCGAENKRRKRPSRPGTLIWAKNPLPIRFRIDLQEPVKEVWRSSMNGRAAFSQHPVDFIRALPDSGRVFIRAITADGNNKDANFQLADVSEIRDKIARSCNWPSISDEPTTGTIKPSQSR